MWQYAVVHCGLVHIVINRGLWSRFVELRSSVVGRKCRREFYVLGSSSSNVMIFLVKVNRVSRVSTVLSVS